MGKHSRGLSDAGEGGPGPSPNLTAPHLLLQQREGCARVDPQVFGGGLPVVSQVGGPVPHHEEVQELGGKWQVKEASM